MSDYTKYTKQEMQAYAIAKNIKENQIVIVGTGLPLIGASLAKRAVCPSCHPIVESGLMDCDPVEVPRSVGDNRFMAHCAVQWPNIRFVGFEANEWLHDEDRLVAFIGGAQIDPYGNVNSTCIFGKGDYLQPTTRFTGSGGANGIATYCNTIIMMQHQKRRFMDHVDYITSCGWMDGPGGRERAGLPGNRGPQMVVTDLGIMASEYVLHKISVLIYATVALLLGGDWLEQSASGLARYLLIGYVIGALIVIALTLLYTWDKVLKLVLMLLDKLPHTPKWDERREEWANSLTELNREAKKVLLVPSIRVKGIAVSLVKLFVLYSIPYAALRLVGCTTLNFAQAQLLASLMLLITSALPNVAGVGPMEFAFLLLFAPWADTAIASSALVLYHVATYFFPFLLSVIVFLREEKKSLKGFDAQSA